MSVKEHDNTVCDDCTPCDKEIQSVIAEDERLDEIGFGNLKLIQKPKDFCYGVDAVILADFAVRCSKNKPQRIFDLGTGTGVIPLILSYKTDAEQIYGLEVQNDSFERALRNARLNNLENRISFVNEDVKDYKQWASDMQGSFDMVVSNPPYFISGGGIINDLAPKTIARHETTAGLKEFLACASYLLKPRGDFYMVHRPSRLADICCYGRENGLEPKDMCFVSPKRDGVPNILLVHMVKGGGKELKFLPQLAVYDEEGNYTEELLEAYRD